MATKERLIKLSGRKYQIVMKLQEAAYKTAINSHVVPVLHTLKQRLHCNGLTSQGFVIWQPRETQWESHFVCFTCVSQISALL